MYTTITSSQTLLELMAFRVSWLAVAAAKPTGTQVTALLYDSCPQIFWGLLQIPFFTKPLLVTRTFCVCVHTCICLVMSDSLWPMDCSPPGSSVHGILQARITEGVTIPFFKACSWARDRTRVSCISCIGRWVLNQCASWEALSLPC